MIWAELFNESVRINLVLNDQKKIGLSKYKYIIIYVHIQYIQTLYITYIMCVI
jgi:hypothetical protein